MILLPFRNLLASGLYLLSEWAADRARDLKVCTRCGENFYYGLPCPEYRRPNQKAVINDTF